MGGSDEDEPWFGRTSRGHKSAQPITWQGWAVCIAYGLLMTGAALMIRVSWIAAAGIFAAGTAAFIWVLVQKTHWQPGKDD